MRVKITDATTGQDYWLTGSNPQEWPDQLRVNDQILEQVAEFCRAEQIKTFNRGNARTTVAFNISREHASGAAAEYFILTHAASLSRDGLATFVVVTDSGGEIEVYLPNAVVRVTGHSHIGCSSHHSYDIIGGKLTLTKPQS